MARRSSAALTKAAKDKAKHGDSWTGDAKHAAGIDSTDCYLRSSVSNPSEIFQLFGIDQVRGLKDDDAMQAALHTTEQYH